MNKKDALFLKKLDNSLETREKEYLKARTLVSRLIDGMSIKTALHQAGYSNNVDTIGLLERPEIKALLGTMMRDRAQTLHAPKALKFMADTLKDKDASARIRFECAKHLLNLAGFQPPKVMPAAKTDYGAPSEMSSAELQATIDRLQSEVGQRVSGAKVVNVEPVELDIFC